MSTDPSHSIRGLLRWVRAPNDVQEWAASERLAAQQVTEVGRDASPLLDRAPNTRATLWLLAVLGVHADVLATAVGMLLESRAQRLTEPRLGRAIEVALSTLIDPERGEAALREAKLCELLGETTQAKHDGSYRDSNGPFSRLCKAVSAFARAAEAIGAYGARMEAERLENARKTAGILAVGISSMVAHQRVLPPTLNRPIALHFDPPHELVFASEHLALALGELEQHESATHLAHELLEHLETE